MERRARERSSDSSLRRSEARARGEGEGEDCPPVPPFPRRPLRTRVLRTDPFPCQWAAAVLVVVGRGAATAAGSE